MASSGPQQSFSRTIDKGSEELFDYTCSRCKGKKKVQEASHYCPTCDTYYCGRCLVIHEEFFSDTDHGVLGVSRGTQWSRKTNEEECPDHSGHKLTMFCRAHKDMCCSICVSVDHKFCDTMQFLPKVANGILKSKEFQSVKENIEKAKDSAKQLIISKIDSKKDLDNSREIFQNTLKTTRKKIRTTFDKLQERATKEMDSLYYDECKTISADISHCESLLAELEREQARLKEDAGNESLVFIKMKNMQTKLLKYQKTIVKLSEGNPKEKLSFTMDADLLKFLDTINTLGSFGVAQTKPPPKLTDVRRTRRKTSILKKQLTQKYAGKVITKSEQIDIRVGEDDDECCIQGMCKLPNGNLVVSDYNNKKLKQLKDLHKIIDSCTMPSEPCGVCCIGQDEVAVALENGVIQYVSVSQRMKKTRSIQTNHGCYGLAYHDGNLYVTECGGKKVYVHDISGKPLHNIQSNMSGEDLFSYVYHICLSEEGDLLYVVDRDKGLVTLCVNWLSETGHPELIDARGVCTDMDANVFVCGNLSHNVVQFEEGGTRALKPMVSRSDGILAPEFVYFDTEKSKLVVSSSNSGECDLLTLFEVE